MIRPTLLALAFSVSLAACAAETPATADGKAAAKAAAPATADEATRERIQAALQALAPGMKVDAIAPSPISGFLEVALGARVIYVSQDGKQLLQGSLIDIASRESLTQASEAKLRRDMLANVGDDTGITFAAANPKYEVTVFTDIDCGYCRRMHSEIAEYNRLGITVNYLFYPRAGIGSESFQKAVNVWCAPDRRKALTEAKAGKILPKANCTNPVTMDYDLGRRMRLPEPIAAPMQAYVNTAIAASAQTFNAINELDELLETGFGGREIKLIETMIDELDRLERETDDQQIAIRAELFKLEPELPPVDVMFLYKVIDYVGDLADRAQKVGGFLHMLLAR